MPETRLRRILPEISSMLLFLVTSLFSVYISLYLKSSGNAPSQSSSLNILEIVVYIVATLVFSAIVIVLARKKKLRIVKIVFLVLAAYIVFYMATVIGEIFYTFVYEIYSGFGILALSTEATFATYSYYIIIVALPAVLIYYLVVRNEWYVTDTVGFLMTAGIASVWGLLLGVWYAVALLAVFAVYDYISVYRTKHMLTLAKAAVDESLPMLFVFPHSRDFSMNGLTWDNRGEGEVMMLGFGDIALPAVMVVSSAVYGYSTSYFYLLLPLIGALAGMAILLFFGVKKPAPGLPFINSGAILGFLLAFALFR